METAEGAGRIRILMVCVFDVAGRLLAIQVFAHLRLVFRLVRGCAIFGHALSPVIDMLFEKSRQARKNRGLPDSSYFTDRKHESLSCVITAW
jgi:hypothetical protein